MQENKKIYDTIIDYLSHDLNDAETESFEKWLNESEKNQNLFQKIEQQWNSFNNDKSTQKTEAWKSLNSSIEERQRGFIKRNSFSIAVAASILILICAGWFLKSTTSKMVSIVTNQDTFKRDTLENGCIVFLYPSSSIEFENNNSYTHNQVINLTGQAFFVVPPKLGIKMKIKIGEACIDVKGTSFKVNGANNHEISVIVESGEVVLKSNNKKENQLLVHAGEEGFYYRDKDQLSKKTKSENIYIIYQPLDSLKIQ